MDQNEPLCDLMALLAPRERLAILGVILECPGTSTADIAQMLGTVLYDINPHLTALHEGGAIVEEDGRWELSPRVNIDADDEFLHFEATALDGSVLRFRHNLTEAP